MRNLRSRIGPRPLAAGELLANQRQEAAKGDPGLKPGAVGIDVNGVVEQSRVVGKRSRDVDERQVMASREPGHQRVVQIGGAAQVRVAIGPAGLVQVPENDHIPYRIELHPVVDQPLE